MALAPRQVAGLLFIVAAVVSAAGALNSWVRGRGPNGPMLVLVIVWLVLGIAMLRGTPGGGSDGAG